MGGREGGREGREGGRREGGSRSHCTMYCVTTNTNCMYIISQYKLVHVCKEVYDRTKSTCTNCSSLNNKSYPPQMKYINQFPEGKGGRDTCILQEGTVQPHVHC